jgi:hypothetical protein
MSAGFDRRDDSAMLSALDAVRITVAALATTVDTLGRTADALKSSVESLNDSVETQKEMIYGREDPETLKHIPGLRDTLLKHEFWLRWGGLAMAGAMAVLVLHALGLPTEWVGKAIKSATGIGGP